MQSATASSAFGLSAIGQIGITVTDVDRAIRFYRDGLGLKFLFQAGSLGFFDCAGVRLMLSDDGKPGQAHSSILYFRVPEIHAASRILEERGVTFEQPAHLVARMPDHDLWMAFLRDPDRNLLAIMSEIPRPA
jgi:catechol 2,3-dioxygenase-like lactoylglutathione lyase family enzyme